MIKLKLADLPPMMESLTTLISLPLPAKESYRLGVAAKQIQDKLVVYEQTRHKLVNKFGTKIEEENVIKVKPENMDAFTKEMQGLLSEEIELNMSPISIEMLGESKVSARDMAILSPFFYDPETSNETRL